MPFLSGGCCWLCSFQSSYPSWEPDPQGKQFLSNIRAFRDRMLQGHRPSFSYSPPRAWWGRPNTRGYAEWNNFYSRDIHRDALGTGTHLGSRWLIDIDQRNHPYLLDWYYTSNRRPQNGSTANHPTEDPEIGVVAEQHLREDLWTPPDFGQDEARLVESWGREESTMDRSQSHLEASTSAAPLLFRESVFRQHESRDMGLPGRSHWWARSGPNLMQNQTSFIEPPEFGVQRTNMYENRSDRSLEEWEDGEEHLDWRLPQRPAFQPYLEDDIEAGDVSLHFDDVYSKPPETPRVDLEHTSSGW